MAIVAIVGRPNVGKSTLFNRICKKRQALVDDFPGVTRDRIYAQVQWDDRAFTLVDTGGYIGGDLDMLEEETRHQVLSALNEADLVVFLGDGKAGVQSEDQALADLLRRSGKPLLFAVNKIDGPEKEAHAAEFYQLGMEDFYSISAAHGYGVGQLLSAISERLPVQPEAAGVDEEGPGEIRVSIVGRPNVGKSTLLNRILGEERAVVSDIPGTTRDSIDTPLEVNGKKYMLIDTAGIRRKGRTTRKLEKLSIIKALQSIERSHVVVLLVDAVEGPTDQDLHIGGYIQDRRRACIIGINKWDAFTGDSKASRRFLQDLKDRFQFLSFAPVISLSAITGKRVNRVLPTVDEVFAQYNQRTGTGLVNRVLQEAIERHQPPLVAGRRLKFFYGTQAYTRPPTFVLFCNRPDKVHFSYERFLTNHFRQAFGLDKTPLRVVFRSRRKDDER
jgi:GTP-binding protein